MTTYSLFWYTNPLLKLYTRKGTLSLSKIVYVKRYTDPHLKLSTLKRDHFSDRDKISFDKVTFFECVSSHLHAMKLMLTLVILIKLLRCHAHV